MADSVNFSGLSSGIDTNALIKALVDVKRQPIVQLQTQSDAFQSSLTTMNDFGSKLTALRSAASALSVASSFAAFSSSSSDPTVLTVAASSAASEGTHTVTVQQLAAGQTSKSVQTSVSAASPMNYDGNLSLTPFTPAGVSVPSNVVSIAAGDSLTAIRDKINNSVPTAYGSLTFAAVPGKGTKLTVDNSVYEFFDSTDGAYAGTNVGIDVNGATTASIAASLAAASTGPGSTMSVQPGGNVVTVKANSGGSGGNLIAMSDIAASGTTDGAIQLSGSTLSGGIPSYSASVINTGTSVSPSWSLVLTGKGMGESSAFTANFTPTNPADTNLLSFGNSQTARDSIIDIDGMTGIHRSSNVISDLVGGVTLNLVSAPSDKPSVSAGISKDNSAIRDKVQTFLKAYNDLATYIKKNASYDASTKQAGPLLGDTAVSSVSSALTAIRSNSVAGLTGNYNALSRVGIKTGSDGTLTMDAVKFDAAMSADFRGVVDLFTQNLSTGTKGIASQVAAKIDKWMSPVDGLVANRKSSLQSRIKTLGTQMDQKEAAVTLYEQSLKIKYANMEKLVGALKQQSGALSSLSY